MTSSTVSVDTASINTALVPPASVPPASVSGAPVDGPSVVAASTDADSVASGRIYNITEVAGHPPVSARDFVGPVEFSIEWHGSPVRVTGRGVQGSADVVRFFETDVAHGGREARVWDIVTHPGGGFMAYQLAADLPIRSVIPQQVSR